MVNIPRDEVEREGRTGEYWPEVVAVQTERSSDWFFFWSGFRHTDRFRGNGHKLHIFLFSKAGELKENMARVPYNKLLTNLARSSRTEEYWSSVVFVRTSLRSQVGLEALPIMHCV